MLVSFQGHCKYPVRYVWIDKVNADDLNCLLSRILDLCAGNNINVQCITMDGTAVNFISIKLFGGKLGHHLKKIMVISLMMATIIILDPLPILKLARNALGELGIFLDNKCRKIEWKFIT